MAQKYKVSEGLQSMLNAIKAKNKKTTLEDFNNHGITNAQDSVYGKGCVITFPDLDEIDEFIDFEEFTTNGRTSRAPYVACNSTEGPKKVYLSQMTRTVMPYVEEDGKYVQKGDPVHGEGELYNKASQMRTAGDLLKVVAGKEVEVKEIKPVQTARYTNGVITGLRNAQVPVFDFKK